MSIKLKNVRIIFASIFNKATFDGQETKYEATFIIPKSNVELIKELQASVNSIMKETMPGVNLAADKICMKDGDLSQYDSNRDSWLLKASNRTRPLVLNRDKSPLTEADGVIYDGCYVNAVIDFWGQNNKWGKRVLSNLLGVQFVSNGDALGGGVKLSVDAFDDVSSEEPFSI